MDVLSAIASLGSGLGLMKDLGGALLDERDRQKAAAIHIEFTEKLISAQAQLSQVLGAVIEQQRLVPVLEERIRELEAERAEKNRYVLAKLGTEREFFAYRLRTPAELVERVDEEPHFVCQPCFEAGKKIVLVGNGEGYWACPVCKHGAQVERSGGASGYTIDPEPVFRRSRRSVTDGY